MRPSIFLLEHALHDWGGADAVHCHLGYGGRPWKEERRRKVAEVFARGDRQVERGEWRDRPGERDCGKAEADPLLAKRGFPQPVPSPGHGDRCFIYALLEGRSVTGRLHLRHQAVLVTLASSHLHPVGCAPRRLRFLNHDCAPQCRHLSVIDAARVLVVHLSP